MESYEVDDERLTWVRCYGTPVHAWSEEFFKFVVLGTGEFVALDENRAKRKSFDVTRVLIRRKGYDVINFVERFEINSELFVIKVVEDWFAPLQLNQRNLATTPSSSSSSESGEDFDETGGDFPSSGDDVKLSSDEEGSGPMTGQNFR